VTTGVELGTGVSIGPHAVVLGPCRIADGVQIGPSCVIGSPPELTSAAQNLAWDGELEHAGVEIGAGTVVREGTTVQQGSEVPTRIGAACWLLSRSYVAHDCWLGDGVTLSAGVVLGGRTHVGDRANLGMNATVHQGRTVGPGAMIGMSAAVTRDVPPFAKAFGVPARVRGANTVGMSRLGIDELTCAAYEQAYRGGGEPGRPSPPALTGAWSWWDEHRRG
jgi:UDP-N-acetylglucosamine acyltransferase